MNIKELEMCIDTILKEQPQEFTPIATKLYADLRKMINAHDEVILWEAKLDDEGNGPDKSKKNLDIAKAKKDKWMKCFQDTYNAFGV